MAKQASITKTPPTEPEFIAISETSPLESEPTPATDSLPPISTSKNLLNLQEMLGQGLALLVAASITIVLFLFVDQEQIRRFQEYGYFGLFLTSLIGNATIALPIPSLFFTFVAGSTFNWVIVGLVSGVGEALGESTGYLAGFGGSAIIENQKIYGRMKHWMKKHGILTIFVLSVVPNPIIDLAGIAAGASRFGYFKFLLSCWAGKTIKTLIFALAGAYSINWVLDLFGV